MDSVSPKVTAASGAAGGSMPLAIIIVWVLQKIGVDVSAEIGMAIASLMASAAAFVAGWLVKQPPTVAVIQPSPPGTTADDLNRAELERIRQGERP